MIHYFTFSNMFSFAGEQTIDFRVSENAPDTTAYARSAFGPRLTKLLCVFGANASGKSNLLKALQFASGFLSRWSEQEDHNGLNYLPFLMRAEPETESSFSVRFEIADVLYEYRAEFSMHLMTMEQILVQEANAKRPSTILEKSWEPDANEYRVRIPSARKDLPHSILGKIPAVRTRRDVSTVATVAQFDLPAMRTIADYWRDVSPTQSRARRGSGKGGASRHQHPNLFFRQSPKQLDRAIELLAASDLGIARIRIEEVEPDAGLAANQDGSKPLEVVVDHTLPSAIEGRWPLALESEGTRSLYAMLGDLLPVLDRGGLVSIDEMDSILHPLMVLRILDEFTSAETNPHNAQLICTCHSIPVMNHLDKYQIMLVEKDENLESHAWRLDEMKGVRADENFYAKYMAGAYGAVPDFKD